MVPRRVARIRRFSRFLVKFPRFVWLNRSARRIVAPEPRRELGYVTPRRLKRES